MGRYATEAQAEARRQQLARQAEALKGHRFGRGRRTARSPGAGSFLVTFYHGNMRHVQRHKTLRAAIADAVEARNRTGGYVIVEKNGREVAEVGPTGVKVKGGKGFLSGSGWDSVKSRGRRSPMIPAVAVSGQGHAVHVDGRGRAKPVKNLGWLLRNWKDVNRFEVTESPVPGWDALLIAYLNDGGRYESTFASKTVLKDFLHRPVFRGVTLYWFGSRMKA